MALEYTAEQFINRLKELQPPGAAPDDFTAVGMGQIFGLARECMNMSPTEIERLLESQIHPVRVGAVSIMDWQVRSRKTSDERRRALFDLYIRRHDRINTWDLVDRSAINVVGEYLSDKPRGALYELAGSADPMKRRTAILSTYAFMRRGQVDDTLAIAERLVEDPEDTVHKAVGWMLRELGKRNRDLHAAFLERHAARMPRVMLRYAVEKLEKTERDRLLGLKRPRP
jgi:hypothetical protein